MGDAGYRGVSAEQDGRYRNKEQALLKKLAKDGQFPAHFDQRVNMSKVNIEVMRPWIAERVEQLLGFEDDVVAEYVNGMLEDPDNVQPDPRKLQLSLTGFLEKSTPIFMSELWSLLLSAQNSIGGIPQQFVEKKKEEMRQAKLRDANAITESGAIRPPSGPQQRRGQGPHRGYSRWDHGHRPQSDSRQRFVDKRGNTTERVRDQGWTRRPPSESHRDRSPSPYRGRRDRRKSPEYESGRNIRRSRSPSYSPSYSPTYRQRDYGYEDSRRRARDSSRTPPQPSRRRSISYTPPAEDSRSHKSRFRSPSTPPRYAGRERSATRSLSYSPTPPPRTRQRSLSRSLSPTPYRASASRAR